MSGNGELGKLIRQARKQKGMTQTVLAERAYTTQKSISRIENGKDNPSFLTMLSILQALDLDCIIGDMNNPLFSLQQKKAE